jgi:exodeoxyribonuclease V gamma subunit
VDVDLDMGEFRLTGHLEVSPASGLVHRRFATIKTKDRLNGWIRHLVLNAVQAVPREAMQSVIIGLGASREKTSWEMVAFGRVSDAHALLLKLLKLYKEGLRRPLPFFPDSSWAYARAVVQEKLEGRKAILKALQVWDGTNFSRGEKEDPYMELCFRKRNPIDTKAFSRTSLDVLRPVMDNESGAA